MSLELTKIVVADQHFLYLPLYYAHHKNYFGLLPKDCRVEIIRSTRHTDASAFEMLMDENSPQHRGIDIALCDPATILFRAQPNTHPVVLAGLLTNAAFWVVNHKANKGPWLENLSTFDEIISFDKGTTSFGIASRIFQAPGKASGIRTVNPNEELNLLVDSGPSTIALSPDILGIQQLLETKGHAFGIEMALADTDEYHGMLVTGLLTRRDVLERKKELVSALLQAVQKALVQVRGNVDEVIAYGCDRFGEQKHTVEKALAEASRTRVYPADIKISRPSWMKLAETAYLSLEHRYDDQARTKALSLYHRMVEPYEIWAEDAVKASLLPDTTTPAILDRVTPLLAGAIPVALLALICILHLMVAPALPWYTYLCLALSVGVAVAGARYAGVVPWTLAGATYWIPLTLIFLAIIALGDLTSAKEVTAKLLDLDANTVLSKTTLLPAIFATVVAELKHVETLRRKRS